MKKYALFYTEAVEMKKALSEGKLFSSKVIIFEGEPESAIAEFSKDNPSVFPLVVIDDEQMKELISYFK